MSVANRDRYAISRLKKHQKSGLTAHRIITHSGSRRDVQDFLYFKMKRTFLSYLVCGAFLSYCAVRVMAQNFEDPKRYYKQMKMDDLPRGTFNITPCLRELLNCWEIIPPEMVCGHGQRLMSICDLRNERLCEDKSGWGKSGWDSSYPTFHMFDFNCPKGFEKKENLIWNAFGGPRWGGYNGSEEYYLSGGKAGIKSRVRSGYEHY